MQQLDLAPGLFQPEIHPGSAARRTASKTLGELAAPASYAVVCPFTTRPQKEWIDSRWAKLVVRIKNKLNLAVVMLGGSTDVADGQQLQSMAGGRLFNLTGKTSLSESAEISTAVTDSQEPAKCTAKAPLLQKQSNACPDAYPDAAKRFSL